MNSPFTLGTRLVADVGGTNTRLALFDPTRNEFRALGTYINRDFAQFEDVITDWLTRLHEAPPETACIAIAAPPGQDRVDMFNMDWSFSCNDLARRFGLKQAGWINDFVGNAYSLPHLGGSDRIELHSPTDARAPGDNKRLAVVGPGTGLGGATVEAVGTGHMACACEPGHMGLSPADAEELALFSLLLPRHDNIYAELLVSGPGLQRLYEALAHIRGQTVDTRTPAEVSTRALAGDPLCSEALNTFCGLLGSVCGDFVLATGSYGGLYLAGGIIPRMIPFLEQSAFLERFVAKGAMRKHLAEIPIYAITTPHPGLIGAAHAPLA